MTSSLFHASPRTAVALSACRSQARNPAAQAVLNPPFLCRTVCGDDVRAPLFSSSTKPSCHSLIVAARCERCAAPRCRTRAPTSSAPRACSPLPAQMTSTSSRECTCCCSLAAARRARGGPGAPARSAATAWCSLAATWTARLSTAALGSAWWRRRRRRAPHVHTWGRQARGEAAQGRRWRAEAARTGRMQAAAGSSEQATPPRPADLRTGNLASYTCA